MAREPVKTVEEKFSIVFEGLKENTNIAELCRRHGISQTSFYKWRDKFLEGGKTSLPTVLDRQRAMPRRRRWLSWNASLASRQSRSRSLKKT
ncbi:MAG TPA: transposase [Bacteroidota bacterium]